MRSASLYFLVKRCSFHMSFDFSYNVVIDDSSQVEDVDGGSVQNSGYILTPDYIICDEAIIVIVIVILVIIIITLQSVVRYETNNNS